MIGELIERLVLDWFRNNWVGLVLAFSLIGLAVLIERVAEKRRT